MIASQILNENEPAGLKYQYSDKIDPSIGEYHIDTFFNPDDYAFVDPETFSLYAATDAYETFLLYEHQKKEFEKPGNEKMYNTLFKGTEMPDVTHIAEMEMWGMNVDKEFADRLSKKFHIKLDEVDKKIDMEMSKYKDIITQWRSTEEANFKGKNYIDLKSVDSSDIKSKKWDGKDEKGYYKYNKSLSEKLADPIELTSPTQLGILLYDVLKVLKVGKDKKKVVDEATLLGIEDKLSLVNLILKKREYEKYLGTYIDALPKLVNPRDGRLHAKINQLGREEKNVVTGRMSSSDPNLQNIPARGDIVSVRCMFTPSIFYNEYEKDFKNIYEIPIEEECLMSDGSYKWVSELEYGDVLDTGEKVISIGRSTGDRLIRVGVE